MSARTKSARQTKTAANAKNARQTKPAKATKPAAKKPAPEPQAEETSHTALVGIATRTRTVDRKIPAKHILFEVFLRSPVQSNADLEKLAKKYPTVKPSTVRSWFSNWRLGIDKGGYYPASLRGREALLTAALKKIAKAQA